MSDTEKAHKLVEKARFAVDQAINELGGVNDDYGGLSKIRCVQQLKKTRDHVHLWELSLYAQAEEERDLVNRD